MNLKLDFLVKEIFIKIITKGLGIFRTLLLLLFFSVSSTLDDFYYAKSIVGFIILINIFFEITHSQELNKYKNNPVFVKKYCIILNKLSLIIGIPLIIISFLIFENSQIMSHIIILSIWAWFNINSNYFLLIFRYKNRNTKVLLYYFLISIFDILILVLMLEYFSLRSDFFAISLSLLFSELLIFSIIFSKYCFQCLTKTHSTKIETGIKESTLYKVLLILAFVSLIEISDKFFLSLLGEGLITYYSYGLYGALMIRQSLDIRSNFFVKINKSKNIHQTKIIFYDTIKKLIPFFILGVILLFLLIELFEDVIQNTFHMENINMFKNIVYLGALIAPFYMIWDLFYRFYYREGQINRLIIMVFLGLIVNVILNFYLGISLSWGVYGILISTLAVFLFYNILSYQYFFVNKKNRG